MVLTEKSPRRKNAVQRRCSPNRSFLPSGCFSLRPSICLWPACTISPGTNSDRPGRAPSAGAWLPGVRPRTEPRQATLVGLPDVPQWTTHELAGEGEQPGPGREPLTRAGPAPHSRHLPRPCRRLCLRSNQKCAVQTGPRFPLSQQFVLLIIFGMS